MSKPIRGWVYVISNPAMPNLLKVGFTLKDPALRAKELAGTGIAHPFKVEYEVLVNNPRDLEQRVHVALSNFNEAKEWFRCSICKVIEQISLHATDDFYIENKYFDVLFTEDENRESVAISADFENPVDDRQNETKVHFQRTRKHNDSCKICGTLFNVTITRFDRGVACPVCNSFQLLAD